MSNHIGFFNGTGVVNSNQPNKSKVKLSGGKPKKDIEYFKIGFYCNGSMVDNDGDFKDKKVEVERIVGVEKGFNWVPVQNYLCQYSFGAEKLLQKTGDYTSYDSKWFRIPTQKTADAIVLSKNNLVQETNSLVGDFCHLFNRNMAKTKKLHTKEINLETLMPDNQPEM